MSFQTRLKTAGRFCLGAVMIPSPEKSDSCLQSHTHTASYLIYIPESHHVGSHTNTQPEWCHCSPLPATDKNLQHPDRGLFLTPNPPSVRVSWQTHWCHSQRGTVAFYPCTAAYADLKTENGRVGRGVVCWEARAKALELKLQPEGENSALSAPINLIRIPDMRSRG